MRVDPSAFVTGSDVGIVKLGEDGGVVVAGGGGGGVSVEVGAGSASVLVVGAAGSSEVEVVGSGSSPDGFTVRWPSGGASPVAKDEELEPETTELEVAEELAVS